MIPAGLLFNRLRFDMLQSDMTFLVQTVYSQEDKIKGLESEVKGWKQQVIEMREEFHKFMIVARATKSVQFDVFNSQQPGVKRTYSQRDMNLRKTH